MLQAQDKPTGNGQQLPYRYDGRLKVMGKATYAAEFPTDGVLFAWLVTATVPAGEIVSMDTTTADRASGVVKILTPFNAPVLPGSAPKPGTTRSVSLLQDRQVYYNGEPIGVVVGKTLDEARYAASLVRVKYNKTPPKLHFDQRLTEGRKPKRQGHPAEQDHGQAAAAWAKATTVLDEVYTTPLHTHNPMEPHATIAQWNDEKLTVWDATQYISGVKQTLAKNFSLPMDNVHVIDPYVGGGFGCKGTAWSHVMLAAMAAKVCGAPVKLVLDRTQMFGPVGGRPATTQHIKLGADSTGKLVAMQHDNIEPASLMQDFNESSPEVTTMLYHCEQIAIDTKMVDMNIGVQTYMRAPGESTGTTALETAMDELAIKLNMDPLELRLKNYAEKDPGEQKDFTSKHLREAYADAAERFGWSKRTAAGKQTVGNKLIGYGMATATYPANRSPANASISLLPSGRILIASGTQDLGTGMYTMMAQTVMQETGVPWQQVDAKLGDSTLPKAPVSGGSQSTASVMPAVKAACQQLQLKLATLAVADANSVFHGVDTAELQLKGGVLVSKTDPSKSEPLSMSIARNQGKAIEEKASAEPEQEVTRALSAHSWGAVFVEVAVDRTTWQVEVRRVVATYDIGTLLNEKTGKSQLEGGIVWGISLALEEDSHLDNTYGRIVNNNLGEYHVPVNADVQTIEVKCLGIPDLKFNPQGARGIGEIGITGIAGAINNAIFNATGKRVRSFPITPDKLQAA